MAQNRNGALQAAPPPGFEGFSRASSLTFENFDADEELALENAWCFWHDKFIGGLSGAEYEASLHKLCTFNTVQDFWKYFNNLPPVDKLRPKSSFHLMKDGISPLWEDPKNASGGFWALRVKKEDTAMVWKELVLAIIGEQFEPVLANGDEICGLTVSIRQYDDVVRLWNTNASTSTPSLLNRIKELLPDVELRNPFYKENKEHIAFSKELHEKKSEGGDGVAPHGNGNGNGNGTSNSNSN